MPVANNHGLTVLTNADSDPNADPTANLRLRRPVAEDITNRFNDATSGALTPDFSSGHEGLDFAGGAGIAVHAMYSGEVVDIYKEYRIADAYPAYGIKVVIESILANGAGFQHTYAHLAHPRHLLENPNTPDSAVNPHTPFAAVSLANPARQFTWDDYQNAKKLLDLVARGNSQSGTMLTKGQVIGVSGATGTDKAHLHVHVKPFNERGAVTTEFAPDNDPDNLPQPYPPLATRISGCMNFACFLPADSGAPAIEAEGPLLSARDAYAFAIPVYTTNEGTKLLGTINGSKLGCYAVTGQDPEQGIPTRYQIQFTAGAETGRGWVSRLGTVGTHSNVQWVHVQDNTISLQIIPPEPVVIGRPQDLDVAVSGAVVTLTWRAPERPVEITGYQVERYEPPSAFSPGAPTVFSEVSATTHTWTDTTVAAVPQALVYYRVTARVGDSYGVPTRYRSATPGVTTTNPDPGTPESGQVAVSATVAVSVKDTPGGAHNLFIWAAEAWANAIGRFHGVVDSVEETWIQIQRRETAEQGTGRARAAAAQSRAVVGWVPLSVLTGGSNWAPRVRALPQPPFARVTAPGVVPVRPGPDLGYTEYVAQIERSGGWYALLGKNGSWWQVRVAASTVGWLRAQDVETTRRHLDGRTFCGRVAGPGAGGAGGHAARRARGHAGQWPLPEPGQQLGRRVGGLQGRARGDGGLPEHALAGAVVRAG